MRKIKVRCWQVESYRENNIDHVYKTFPDCGHGHQLITCLNCGEIYAYSIEVELYADTPLEKKLKETKCISCCVSLNNNYAEYPSTYVVDGKQFRFKRNFVDKLQGIPEFIPDDKSSFWKEFYSLY